MLLTETEVLKRLTVPQLWEKSKRISHLNHLKCRWCEHIEKNKFLGPSQQKAVRKNIDYTNQDYILHLVNNISHVTLW